MHWFLTFIGIKEKHKSKLSKDFGHKIFFKSVVFDFFSLTSCIFLIAIELM